MSESFGLIKGLKVTFKELFRKSVTDKYPKDFMVVMYLISMKMVWKSV